MLGIIQSIKENQLDEALEFVKQVFTDSEGEESGELVKNLVKEIRSKKYYIPAPECLMIQELVPGALKDVHGYLNYKIYDALR